ncbi:hypothetical protein HNQ93_002724 [Hymenobacter luteus]|uniref:Uncharacterized protein n=2 Tax=Hymenobacter TaxID=89966 RepID=A0A7W9T2Y3_9BACT|nr:MULTISPECIES: hypothetical protein [Hymenobacter]MBB4601707.1 hypothetical protein [Hymenobacter latericoloratus]MBB6059864.1 hypothetical protein [Hymenobacter luteus]
MTSPYRLYPDHPDDFEARVRLLRPDEGGRQLLPCNGIRWDFGYAQDRPLISYMWLHPDFYDPETGNSLQELPLPVDKWLHARVAILLAAARSFHRPKLWPGTSFHYCEGSRIVAEGTVTRLTGLGQPRP